MKVHLSRGLLDLSFIQVLPGDWVVVKPNLIKESSLVHRGQWASVLTSPVVIEQVCEHVGSQLRGQGRIRNTK